MALVPRLEAVTPKFTVENKIENEALSTHYLLYIQIIINIITHNQSHSKSKYMFNEQILNKLP